jgi:PAS domain S-box-containing protein
MTTDTADEHSRLASLHALNILDTQPDASFDGLVEVAATVCGAPISLISLIDEDRQWFKANRGLPGTTETPRELAFCAQAIEDNNDILEVPDASTDARFKSNPLVTGQPDIRFYAGAKLTLGNGAVVGTLCVIDRKPKILTTVQRKVLRHLANAAVDLMEARRVTDALATSESKFRGLCDAAPLGIFSSDRNGACNYTNHECQQMLGITEEQALGSGWQSRVHADDLQNVLNRLVKTLKQETTFDSDFRITHDDGQVKHVRAIAVPTFSADGSLNGTVGIIEDTTTRVREQNALTEERSRLASIIKGIGAGTWEWNVQTGEFRVNERFREISGHPELPFANVNDTRFQVHPDDLKNSDKAMQQHLVGESKRFAFERRLEQEGGEWRWVFDCGQIVTRTADGKPEWMFGARLDINELKVQAQQLATANDHMATAHRRNAVTQERLRMARDMHDTLAHSLMALLTQIRVVRKLRKRLPEEELEAELESLEAVAVTGIAEARAAIMQMRHNDVSEIGLDGAIQSLSDRFSEQSGIIARIRIDKQATTVDKQQAETLFRITEEALHNVERHARADLVSIRIVPAPDRYGDESRKRFRLSIADNGIGFSPSRRQPGHYGLRGMEEQAALINGEFSVSSKPNHGTTVSVDFDIPG